jgi:ATP-dependent Lon protease
MRKLAEKLPQALREEMTFIGVEQIDEVLQAALRDGQGPALQMEKATD